MPKFSVDFEQKRNIWNQQFEDIQERSDRLLNYPGKNYKDELDHIEKMIEQNDPPKVSFSLAAFFRNAWNKLFGDGKGDEEYNDYKESKLLNEKWPDKKQKMLEQLTEDREKVAKVYEQNLHRADRNDDREYHLKNKEAVAEYRGFFDKLDRVQDRLRDMLKGLLEKQDDIVNDLKGNSIDADERAMLSTGLDTYKHNTASCIGAAIATGILYNKLNSGEDLGPEFKDFAQKATQKEIEEKMFEFSARMSEQFGNELLADRLLLFEMDENNRGMLDDYAAGKITEYDLTEKFLGTLSDREKVILETGKDPGPEPEPEPWETEEYDRVMYEDENVLNPLKEEDVKALENILDGEEFGNGEFFAKEIDEKFKMDGEEMKAPETLDF